MVIPAHAGVILAAPVDIANEPYLVGAVVRLFDDSNSYYLHEVLIEKRTASPVLFKTGTDFTGNPSRGDHPSVISLLEQVRNVKHGKQGKQALHGRQSNLADMDAVYMHAVESGDMETAKRMVDERAQQLGYVKAWHNTYGDFSNSCTRGGDLADNSACASYSIMLCFACQNK